jgi:hypothetical protein
MKALKLCSLALMLLVLAACQVSVDVGMPPGLSVSNTRYETNFQASINGQNRYVICDDRETTLTYRFDYTGSLTSWSSYLRGRDSGVIEGRARFTSADIVTPGRVIVDYRIPRELAPLSEGVQPTSEISPESIIVVPRILGYTELWLDIGNFRNSYRFGPIPVLATCN